MTACYRTFLDDTIYFKTVTLACKSVMVSKSRYKYSLSLQSNKDLQIMSHFIKTDINLILYLRVG